MIFYNTNLTEDNQVSISDDSIKLSNLLKFIEKCASAVSIDSNLKFDCVDMARIGKLYEFYIPIKQGLCLLISDVMDLQNELSKFYDVLIFVFPSGELNISLKLYES